jgi:phytoene/squalene synthetase
MEKSVAYCRDAVRKSDWESFMASLFLPAGNGVRDTVWAIRAFNVEIAQIGDQTGSGGRAARQGQFQTMNNGSQVSDLAKIRFQFWRDAIDGIYKVSLSPSKLQNT